MSSHFIITITKKISNKDNGLFVPIFKAKFLPHLRRFEAKFGRFVMSNALKKYLIAVHHCPIVSAISRKLLIGH